MANSTPRIAPAGDWVETVAIPDPNPALADRPFQALLIASQSRYEAHRHEHHSEMAVLIQNSQGLQALGNISLPWQPDHVELIIHKVHILRRGTVIDLLAEGHEFTVLRRENNLESAMLDGVLTAMMQAEGLTVGDVLHVAFTLRRHPGALPLRGENAFAMAHGAPVRRFHVRQIWGPDIDIRWRATGMMEQARTRRTRHGTELVLDLMDAEGDQPPDQAPTRFMLPALLQVSGYRDWAEISSQLAPHYARAAELSPNSRLRPEIERIAAASEDPAARAMAALRLVQDEVRYFAVTLGDGNYLPATADQTWIRRYGDCKGKTAVLLALLHGLGIEADAVLVNTITGDGMDERLPQMILFNHVIVRARIGDATYWLDGTRSGDRDLHDLASAPYAWGLPLSEAGAELQAIAYAPPRLALVETNITYDASQGFDDLTPTRFEMLFRGDSATAMRAALSQIGREAFLRHYRENEGDLPGQDVEIVSVDLRDDEEAGSFTVIVEARARLTFRPAPGALSRRYRFGNDTISWTVNLDRREGPWRDAPFTFAIPDHLAGTETMILPNDGRGYSIDGESFDRIVAGVRIARRIELAGGRAVARSTFQRIAREVSASQARADLAEIERIRNDAAYLRAPISVGARPSAPARVEPDASAERLVDAGYEKMGAGRTEAALADFDQAIRQQPDWARPHANRGIALIHLNRLDEAERALTTAQRLNDEDFVVHQGLGFLNLRRDQPEAAIPSLTRSLELDPGNMFTTGLRIDSREQLGQLDEALADIDVMLREEPRHAYALSRRARILAHQDRRDEALEAIDAALASDPGNFMFAITKGDLLVRFGRTEEAARAYDAALGMMGVLAEASGGEAPVDHARMLALMGRTDEALAAADAHLRRYAGAVRMLAMRCWIRAWANLAIERALRDCNEALEAEPDHEEASSARALVHLRLRRWSAAIRDFDTLLRYQPYAAHAYYGRALARAESGDADGAARDFATARRHAFDIDALFVRIGLAHAADQDPADQGTIVTNR
ncbi:MAG: DUF3857 domain-containing protein [Sphingomonas sp.]|nr:DUF3857 domain-containing protein [Sphingomonas sp.]